jgi:hypothetical protein
MIEFGRKSRNTVAVATTVAFAAPMMAPPIGDDAPVNVVVAVSPRRREHAEVGEHDEQPLPGQGAVANEQSVAQTLPPVGVVRRRPQITMKRVARTAPRRGRFILSTPARRAVVDRTDDA